MFPSFGISGVDELIMVGVGEDSGEVWEVYGGFEEGDKGRCCTDDERTGKE